MVGLLNVRQRHRLPMPNLLVPRVAFAQLQDAHFKINDQTRDPVSQGHLRSQPPSGTAIPCHLPVDRSRPKGGGPRDGSPNMALVKRVHFAPLGDTHCQPLGSGSKIAHRCQFAVAGQSDMAPYLLSERVWCQGKKVLILMGFRSRQENRNRRRSTNLQPSVMRIAPTDFAAAAIDNEPLAVKKPRSAVERGSPRNRRPSCFCAAAWMP